MLIVPRRSVLQSLYTSRTSSIEPGRDPEARQVIERHHGLVGAHVPGVRDPPAAVRAALVPVLVEGRALDHDAVFGGDHGVLERPRAAGHLAVHGDLWLARAVHGDHVRPELGPQERDDLVPAGDLQRLAVGGRPVVHGGVRREHLRELVPQLQVDAAQIAVLQLTDLFERGKVHGHQLGASC
jgi:hypothetical protein